MRARPPADLAPADHAAELKQLRAGAHRQNPMQVQQGVAQVLGVKQHTITVKQHHAGGAFGGKLTRNIHVAAAAATAAVQLQRPVKLVLDLQTDL